MDSGPRTDLLERSNLTKGQWLLWLGQQLQPGAPLYNMAFSFVIDGAVDPDVMRQAFALLVERCDGMRTIVKAVDGVPHQTVLPAPGAPPAMVDLSAEDDPVAAFHAWTQHRVEQPLDLTRQPFDAALAKLADDRYGWYLNQHHVVSDAWSAGILYEWLRTAYTHLRRGDPGELPELPPYDAYRTYEAEQRSEAEEHPHWRAMRAANVPAADLYGRPPSRVGTANERVACDLGADRLARLRALAREPDAAAFTLDLSLFRLIATALFVYLHRVSGQETLRIGALSHNRPSRSFKQTAGLFTELFPLQIDVAAGDTFRDVLVKVRAESDAFLRSALPGASDAAISRSINTVLNFIRADFGPFDGAPVHATWLHPRHVDPAHHLRLQVHDFAQSGDLRLEFDFNTDVFGEALRRDAIGHFMRVLDGLLGDWDQPVAAVPLIDPAAGRALYAVAETAPSAVPGGDAATVVDMFAAQVSADPDAPAIVAGDRTLSYGELDRRANHLAEQLRGRGVGAGAVVGVCLPRSAEAVVAMLGALKTGAAYVPIDPSWPVPRIELFIADAGLAVVLRERGAAMALSVDTLGVSIADAAPAVDDLALPAPGTPAYIMYTSGSTGRPKGVIIEHRALANYVGWAAGFYADGRRLSFPLFSPLTFDLTVTSIYVPLASGGTIVVYPETDARADMAVLRVFDEDVVDIVKLTPSHLSLLADRDLSRSRIRQLILGGEDLTERLARRTWQQFGGRVAIHNEYGPTEATVGCVLHTYDPDRDVGGSVPIGRPIANLQACVVDAGGNPVPVGIVGELAIGGVGLARGYHGLTELTAERFVRPSPLAETGVYLTGDLARRRPDGVLEYLGRRDDQVKIRGVRIELGEVESALVAHPLVTQCVVDVFHRPEITAVAAHVFCSRCGLASNYPGVSFDDAGVCNHCLAFEAYGERARNYFGTMDDLAAIFDASRAGHPGADYDCVALFSGGKDSTYLLGRLADMGLRILAFTLDNGYISEQAKANIRRVAEALGVEHVFGTTPAMNDIFVDSLERHANVCHGCFKTIYTLSVQIAREKGIPLIVTGLSRGQFFETRLTPELFTDLTVSAGEIDGIVLEARKAYHRIDDAVRRLLDVSTFEDGSVFDEIEFVDFYRYCDVDLDELYAYLDERLPWVRPSDTGRSTNCLINDVGIFVHKRDRGFHNYALPYSWDVRMGHKTRDGALEELDDTIDVDAVQRILREIGYPDDVGPHTADGRLVAYYVAAADIPATQLRRHVRERLPEALVPSRFVRLDAIPMTRHGKVDRAALPESDGAVQTVAHTAYVAPRTDVEETLCAVWATVLGVERVGVHDNFFDLGGDSIMAIQIVAQAHRRGLRLTAGQLFETLTVERLAEVTRMDAVQSAVRAVGPFALTPIQRWFFERPGVAVAHWNQGLSVALPAVASDDAVRAALATVTRHHDAFRMSFTRAGDAWQGRLEDEAPAPELRVIDVSGIDRPGRERAVEDAWRDLHAAFDLAQPPLLRAVLVRATDEPAELLLVAHHLVVDAVSWSILLDDLAAALGDAPGALPAAAVSPKTWGDALAAAVADGPLRAEHAFWSDTVAACASGAVEATADETGPDTVGETKTLCVTLDAARTETLLRDLPKRERVQPNELTLAALALTLAEWRGDRYACLLVEGHGREPVGAVQDLSRTVGWLTSLFPVAVRLPEAGDAGALVRAVKEQLRRIPHRGLGYGALRFLDADAERRAALAIDESRHVLFNYLGDASRLGSNADGLRIVGPLRLDRAPETPRPFALEVNATIADGVLQLEWAYNPRRHAPAVIETRAAACVAHLGRLIDACAQGDAGAVSSSDFPLANLDDDKLSKLSSLLGKKRS